MTDAEQIAELQQALQREHWAHLATVLAAAGWVSHLIAREINHGFRDAIKDAIAAHLEISAVDEADSDSSCGDHFHVSCGLCGQAGIVESQPAANEVIVCPACSARTSMASGRS
jgi:hypothetical protein